MVSVESLLLFSKIVLPCSQLAWSNFSIATYQLPPILFAGSMPTYNLFQKRVTAPIPQTTVLLLWFPAFLKSLSFSLTKRFRGISPLTTFFLIVNITSDLAIFWFSLVTLSNPLLGVSMKLLLLLIVWNKDLISKLHSFSLYPSLCSFIFNFLSDHSIAAVIDGHCSSPEPINSGVPQGHVLSPTLFLLFINDILNLTQCHMHSYADNSILYFFTSFSRRPNQKQINDSRGDATEHLTSDLSLISDWGRENLVLFIASKIQFFLLSTWQNFQDNYLLYFDDTHLSPSSTLNILGLSLTNTLNWKTHISSLAKSASKKLGVLYRFHQFFFSYQLLILYRSILRPCMECTSHVWEGFHAHRGTKQGWVKSFLSYCLPSSKWLSSTSYTRLQCCIYCYLLRYFHANCSSKLTSCMPPPSRSLAAQDFLLTLIRILSIHFMQELTSIFTLSSLLLVNSETLYLNLYFHHPTTWTHLREEYQDTCHPNLASLFYYSFLGNRQSQVGFFFIALGWFSISIRKWINI